MEIPEYFEKGTDFVLNPIRLLYNERRYKYYHMIHMLTNIKHTKHLMSLKPQADCRFNTIKD